MYDHIDYWVKNKKGKTMAFDVKGRKKPVGAVRATVMTGFGLNLKTYKAKKAGLKARLIL